MRCVRALIRADDLTETFEVSVRTIYRDIAHLQASGVPIEGEAGVGYVLRPGFNLAPVTFTHDQLDALAVGLSLVESANDPTLASAAREVRAKLQAGLPSPEERVLADAPYFAPRRSAEPPAHAAERRRAIRERRILSISYSDAEDRRSARRVRPLAIWSLPDGWMFTGWCELWEDFRTFRFDRIADLDVTGERFDEDDARGLAAFMERERCEG